MLKRTRSEKKKKVTTQTESQDPEISTRRDIEGVAEKELALVLITKVARYIKANKRKTCTRARDSATSSKKWKK
jgi:hypothetical protein